MTQSSKLKVQRAHSQALSLYPFRFSTVMTQSSKLKKYTEHIHKQYHGILLDFPDILSSLVSFCLFFF